MRARSAYKLAQLDDQFQFFQSLLSLSFFQWLLDANLIVDLCAAPGSWSQICARAVQHSDGTRGKVVAVDLQHMAPIDGVIDIVGDITSQKTIDRVLSEFEGKKADLVVCDGAPDVTGLHDMDEFLQNQLLFAALQITAKVLKDGGVFVAKVFRGENIPLLFTQLNVFFEEVYCPKPSASRSTSFEAFVVCRGFMSQRTFDIENMISTAVNTTEDKFKNYGIKTPVDAAAALLRFGSADCMLEEAGSPLNAATSVQIDAALATLECWEE